MKIDELDLSMRTFNCLSRAGITTVEELQEKHEDEIISIRGMGNKMITEIRTALEKLENGQQEEASEEETVEVPAEVTTEAPAIDEYNENIGTIKKLLINAAMDFCAIGYYLKEIRDKEQYKEAGYNTIWECAYAEFGLSKSAASRHMTMNDMYSIGGNSAELDKKYISFNKSQLQEMLSLPESEREKVTPETTVTEIRKLNPNSKANKETVAISQQPEVMTKVITSPAVQTTEPEPIVLPDLNVGSFGEIEESVSDSVAISQQQSAEDPAETIIDGVFREIVEETHAITQLELPVLKNMDERERFIKDCKKWPVWTKNELTEETFYRFDLPDGSSIIVRSYPTWLGWKQIEIENQRYYLLKPGYHHFADTETNMTTLKDHLKEVQKNRKEKAC